MSNFIISYNWFVNEATSAEVTGSAPLLSGVQNSLNKPTLIYPNGGETILTRSIEISWKEPSIASVNGIAAWYEILYNSNYDFSNEEDWIVVASGLPIGVNKFIWNIGNEFSTDNMRIAVRTINIRGQKSDMSISAESFKVRRSSLPMPSLLAPVPNSRYGNSIDIVFDDSTVLNQYGQKSRYYIYCRSVKANIPLTTIAQNIPIGTGPIKWDTSMLSPSDDYEIIAYLADDNGNKSPEVTISNITIYNEGFFLIDTKPPSGYLQINNGKEFTRYRDVSVRLFSYDECTGIHSMRFFETNNAGTDVGGPPESYTNLKYYKISENDGVKTLKVVFQDFGANRTTEIVKSFRVLFNNDNVDIADMVLHKDVNGDTSIWVAVNGDAPSIYKFNPNGSIVANVNEEIKSLAVYNNSLFISVKTVDDSALVYKYVGLNELSQTISLDEYNSLVNSMQEYKDNLYLGGNNGILYKYDGTTVNSIKTFDYSIKHIYSDSSLMYILFKNSKNIVIFDGTTFKEVEVT